MPGVRVRQLIAMPESTVTLNIRSIPESVAREFRSQAKLKGMTLGQYIAWIVSAMRDAEE